MKVTLWGINYRPESTGIAPFNAELAEYLAAESHEVSVVTGFAYYPQWRKAHADRHRWYRTDEVNGVKVFRCAQYVPSRVTTRRRILHEFSFGVSSLLRVLLLPRADAYIVVSPPLLLGFCAWLVTRVKRSPYFFHVQDLQPAAAVGLGMIRGRTFIRMLYALERFAYRHAAAVCGISEGIMQEFRRKSVPRTKRVYLPNWLRFSEAPARESGLFRRRFGIPAGNLLAVYSGNLGRKQAIGVLVEAACRLHAGAAPDSPPRVSIVIAGAGAERAAVKRRVEELRIPEVRLLPLLSDEEYGLMLNDADVGLITQASGTGQHFFPSKLLSLLRAGVPVVTVADADSELARAVAEGRFGVNVLPGQADELAATLQRMSEDRGWLAHLARHTRWAERFSPAVVLPQFTRVLEEVVAGTADSGALVGQHEPSRL